MKIGTLNGFDTVFYESLIESLCCNYQNVQALHITKSFVCIEHLVLQLLYSQRTRRY